MKERSGGKGEDTLWESAGEIIDDEELPVIELTDVLDEGSEERGASRWGTVAEPGGAERLGIKKEPGAEPAQEPAGDRGGPGFYEIPPEDFSGSLDVQEDEDFTFTGEGGDEGYGIPEEPFSQWEKKLEAIVTRIVEDVVTRVTRETVAQVTEKVLTAAIEAVRDNTRDPSK